MHPGDLVKFRAVRPTEEFSKVVSDVGLIIEMQTRGPVPGAYVLWPASNTTQWVKIESLEKVREDVSQ